MTVRRHLARGAGALLLVALVVGTTAGVSGAKAKGHLATPTLKTAVGSATIALGSTDTDTATVTGTSHLGSPTGTVTFSACGPTSSATRCTAPDAGSASAGLSPGARHRSTASATIDPGSPGWYCFLDQYTGDAHYKPVSDNNAGTECLDVTGTTSTSTPKLTSALGSATIALGSTDTDTATVTGTASAGSPTGTVTFSACGPTASATPCTAPNAGSATAEVSPESGDRSVASAYIEPETTGWYCFLDQYSGDGNYSAVSDNDTGSECLDVTGSTGTSTPTLRTSLSPSSVPVGTSAVDTATVTGAAAAGSPTGTVTFAACGPTASATPCTSPNIGPATAELSPESGDRADASATITPGAAGWYCFLDQYSGDGSYSAVSDNDTATECLDATATDGTATKVTATRMAVPRRSTATVVTAR